MSTVVALVRALPWAFAGRLGIAFLEITLAAVILSTSIVMGHELRDWRIFYAGANKPWAPTHAPLVSPVVEPRH